LYAQPDRDLEKAGDRLEFQVIGPLRRRMIEDMT
jgi:hypothetical protein